MVEIGSAGVLAAGKWRWPRSLAWLAFLCVAIVLVFNATARATLYLIAWANGGPLASAAGAPVGSKLAGAVAARSR